MMIKRVCEKIKAGSASGMEGKGGMNMQERKVTLIVQAYLTVLTQKTLFVRFTHKRMEREKKKKKE